MGGGGDCVVCAIVTTQCYGTYDGFVMMTYKVWVGGGDCVVCAIVTTQCYGKYDGFVMMTYKVWVGGVIA